MRFASILPLILFITAATDPAYAKYLHCYNGAASDELEEAPPELQRKLMFLDFGLVITVHRKVCGLTDETDRQYVRALYGQAGCTPESEVGQAFDRVLEADITEIEGWSDFEAAVAKYPEYVEEFCTLVKETPWPVYRPDFTPISPELFSEYQESLTGIQAHRERFFKERGVLK